VSITWRHDDDRLVADIDLPVGTTATFTPPADASSSLSVDGVPADAHGPAGLAAGRHQLIVERPYLIG
jgi:hypothetical protein